MSTPTHAPTMPLDRLRWVVDFLLGSAPLAGLWFGDDPPTGLGRYWWRTELQAAFNAVEAVALAPQEQGPREPEREELIPRLRFLSLHYSSGSGLDFARAADALEQNGAAPLPSPEGRERERAMLREVAALDPATPTRDEETECYFCRADWTYTEGWHKDGCLWLRVRALAGEGATPRACDEDGCANPGTRSVMVEGREAYRLCAEHYDWAAPPSEETHDGR